MTNVINVVIYGENQFFGNERKREVCVSSCEFANSCPAFQQGRCAAQNPRRGGCKYLKVETVMGYTSRSPKHAAFMEKWKNHEKFNSVKSPLLNFERIANDEVRIKFPEINIADVLSGKSDGTDTPSKSNGIAYLPKTKVNPTSLKRLMDVKVFIELGGKLAPRGKKEEKEKILFALEKVDQELYGKLKKKMGKSTELV